MNAKILFLFFVFAVTSSEVLCKKADDHGPLDDILTAANIGRFVVRRIHRHRNRGHGQQHSYGDKLVKLNFDKSVHFHQHEHQHKHNHKNYVKHVDHEHVENIQHGPAVQRPLLNNNNNHNNRNNRQRLNTLNRLIQPNNRIIPPLNRPNRPRVRPSHEPPHHLYDFEHAVPLSITIKPEDETESSYVPYAVLN